MRIRITAVIEYDVDEEHLADAYGTTDPVEVIEVEQRLIDGVDGQGDYFMSMLGYADVVSTKVERADE